MVIRNGGDCTVKLKQHADIDNTGIKGKDSFATGEESLYHNR